MTWWRIPSSRRHSRRVGPHGSRSPTSSTHSPGARSKVAIYATTRVAADTGGGTQDIVFPEIDFTPADGEALVLFSVSLAITNQTQANHGVHGAGFTNGTAEACSVISSQDNRTTAQRTLARTRNYANRCISIVNGASTEVAVASFDSWVNGGIRINWNTTPLAGYFIHAAIWAGEGVSAYVAQRLHDTAQDGVESFSSGLSSVSFGMILASKGDFDGTIQNDACKAFGYFDGSLNQVSSNYILRTNTANANPARWQSSNRAAVILQDYVTAPPQAEVTSVASGTIEVTKRNSATNFEMAIAAVEIPTDAWVGRIEQPSSTGTHVHDEPGFPSGMAIFDPSGFGATNYDAIRQFNTSGIDGRSFVDFYGNEFCIAVREENTVVFSFDNACYSTDRAIWTRNHVGNAATEADYVGIDALGFEIDYIDILGTVTKSYPALIVKALHVVSFGATQGSATPSGFNVVQQAVQFSATQGSASASVTAVQVFRASFGATQGSPSASATLVQIHRASFSATQSGPSASATLVQLARASFDATQSGPTASADLVQLFRAAFDAVQGSPSGTATLVQLMGLTFAASQGSPSASATLQQLFRLTFGASQGSASGSFTLNQQAVQFGATQGSATAAFFLQVQSRLTFDATQGSPSAAFELIQQAVQFGATQGSPSASFTLLTALSFQAAFDAIQGSPSASAQLTQLFRLAFGATQSSPTASIDLAQLARLTFGASQGSAVGAFLLQLQARLAFDAQQGGPSAAATLQQLFRLAFGATQSSASALFTLLTDVQDIGATRTCLNAEYRRRTSLGASRSVVTELGADYDRRTDLAATRRSRTSMSASYDRRTDLGARRETCS